MKFQKGITVTGIHCEPRWAYPIYHERAVKKEDFIRIRDMGFDHVRLLAEHDALMTEDFPPVWKEDGWTRLDEVIGWAQESGLETIICMRSVPGYCYRNAYHLIDQANTLFECIAQRKMFLELWQKIALRYKDRGDDVAFELLDRVGMVHYFNGILMKGCGWNNLAGLAIDQIRNISQDRWIILNADGFGSPENLQDLSVLENDSKIAYAFSFYKPELFAKQAAFNHQIIVDYNSLTHSIKSELIYYPGIIPGIEKFLEKFPKYKASLGHYKNAPMDDTLLETVDFAPVAEFRKKYPDKVLYMNSFACVQYANPDSRSNWLRCVVGLCEKYNIGQCYYRYLGSRWGIVDALDETYIDEIALEAMFPERSK